MFTCKDPTLLKNKKSKEVGTEHHVAFDWSDFSEDKKLSAVPVHIDSKHIEKPKPGTKLVVSNLQDPQVWLGDAQTKLVAQLSQLIFPFEEARPFNVYLTINGKRFDLETISSSLRDIALSRFSFSYNEEERNVTLHGKIKLSRLKGGGAGEEKEEIYHKILEEDNGKAFFSHLTNPNNKFKASGVTYLGEAGWFISYDQSFEFKSLSGLAFGKDKKIASPGSFYGEIDEFFYRGIDLESIDDIYSRAANYKDFLKQHVGVRVYRDGFGIRPYGLDGDDWLGLAKGQTSGRSFYGMRPNNVIGYVNLTAKDNYQLKEKTDREGFVDTPHSKNFFLIIDKLVDNINLLYNNLRRSYNEYKQEISEADENSFLNEDFLQGVGQISKTMQQIEEKATTLEKGLEISQKSIDTLVKQATETPLMTIEEQKRVSDILVDTNQNLTDAKLLIDQLKSFTKKWQSIEKRAFTVDVRIQILESQLEEFSELAGLGLTAEVLSHEIYNISDGLAKRTKSITDQLNKKPVGHGELVAYTEYVHSAIAGLQKQLSHLAPSLRYVREQKDDIRIKKFFEDLRSFYVDGRFKSSKIQVILDEPFEDIRIKMNLGKLTQVVDNLFLNSEYWLQDAVNKREIKKPTILVKSKAPCIYMSDNGIGIEKSIEASLFQPFVTMKPKGVGRGLGLFIARQLLDSSGCSISLLPDRNEYGRRYIFQLDFSGALNEK